MIIQKYLNCKLEHYQKNKLKSLPNNWNTKLMRNAALRVNKFSFFANITCNCITYRLWFLLSSFLVSVLPFLLSLFPYWCLSCSLSFFINIILAHQTKVFLSFPGLLETRTVQSKNYTFDNDSEIDMKETRVLVMFFNSTILIFFYCWHISDIFGIVSTYCQIR